MGRRTDMKKCMRDRKVRVIVNSIKATDNEVFNKLHEVVQSARSTLRAYRDLLVESEANFTRLRTVARKHTVPFSPASYPSDNPQPPALLESLKLARDAILSTSAPAPASRPPSRASAEGVQRKRSSAGTTDEDETPTAPGVDSANSVAIRLVDEYLRALQRCANVQCASVMVSYRNVVRHRENGRELANKRESGNVARNTEEEIECRNELAVSTRNYDITLQRNLASLKMLCDKRFVVFKAVRVAFYAAQLRSFDVLADSLVRNIGENTSADLAGVDVASHRMHEYVARYVTILSAINIDKVTPDVVADFKPSGTDDDAVAAALDALPRTAVPPPSASEVALPVTAPLKMPPSPLSVPDETAPIASKALAPEPEAQATLGHVVALAEKSVDSIRPVEPADTIEATTEEKSSSGKITDRTSDAKTSDAKTSDAKTSDAKSAGKATEVTKTPKKRIFLFKRRTAASGDAAKANASSPKSVVPNSPDEELGSAPPAKRTLSVEMLVRKFDPLKS